MSRDNLTLVIADSSRLGTRVLEKILAPLVNVVLCRDAGQLDAALACTPAPRLCLVSHQWPGLDDWLGAPDSNRPAVILLASPDSDARRLAQLCEDHDAGILYRPYDPSQVTREVLHRVADATAGAAATGAVLAQPRPEPQPETASGPADDLPLLARDRAFCKRHGLPHSVMAIRVQDHDGLIRELGAEVVANAENIMFEALQQRLRQEDSVIVREPGRLVLTLPGTPPLGARVLAHRLCAWLQKAEFEIRDYHIHFTIAVGIHCVESESPETAETALEEALSACLVAHANHRSSAVHLSDPASEMAIHQQAPATPAPDPQQASEAPEPVTDSPEEKDPEALWQEVEQALLASRVDGDSAREAVMKKLSGVLRHLSENERMTLVDELLMASALPES